MDRQGDGSETVADQGERVRVRVHRAVRGAGGVRERRGGPVRAERGDELRRRAAGGGCGAVTKCRVAGGVRRALRRRRSRAGGEKDDLWRDCVENPDAWWDNRSRKAEPGGNPRYPDFKHKESQTPLWIESRDTPAWAAEALANGAPSLPSRGLRVRRRRRPRRRAAAKGSTRTTLGTRCRRDPGPAPRTSPTTRSRTRPRWADTSPLSPFPRRTSRRFEPVARIGAFFLFFLVSRELTRELTRRRATGKRHAKQSHALRRTRRVASVVYICTDRA